MSEQPVLILGAGGHTKVLLDMLRHHVNIRVIGIFDIDASKMGEKIFNVPVVGFEDDIIKKFDPANVKLVNGIGSSKSVAAREKIFLKFKSEGYQFLTVIHPGAYIASTAIIGEGSQIFAGSIIQPDTKIGNNVIINTAASIDHDCVIGDHVHIAPGVVCCGNVYIEKRTHIGCGAVIRQNVHIGESSLIAAGAVVINDISHGKKAAGIPARYME